MAGKLEMTRIALAAVAAVAPVVPMRRVLLARAGASALGLLAGVPAALAQPMISVQEQDLELEYAMVRLLGSKPALRNGRVSIDVPELAENGNSVSCSVTVDSPMSATDHCTAIHLFLARNPRPWAVSVRFVADAPRAAFETRIRLAASQRLTAVAAMNDGSFWSGAVDVVVTVSACVDGS